MAMAKWHYLGNLLQGTLLKTVVILILLTFLSAPVESFYRQGDWAYKPDLANLEYIHAWTMYTTEKSRTISGSDVKVMDPQYTPDFRIEEPPYTRFYDRSFFEEERPYRISPHFKQMRRHEYWDYSMAGCTCVTTYKKFTMLAACCVITSRHILTTATSTEVVLRRYRHFKFLQGILGFWYDTDANLYNSTLYAHPARIHYHPKYIRPKEVNRTHPFPAVFDLAVWAATYRFYTSWFGSNTVICPRAGSHRNEHSSAIPTKQHRERVALVTGFQFMKAYHRIPMPWYKYMIMTRRHYIPCPKVEWGWLHCVRGHWAKLGLDSGSPLFRVLKSGWRYSGLMGMNVISMKLRSKDILHYFQVLESHPVLDFLYDAFMGNYEKEWLDFRFTDTKGRSPTPKNDSLILRTRYDFGEELYKGMVPNY